MRTISKPTSALLVTALNVLFLTGCVASPVLERPDDASGAAQRSNAPPSDETPYAQPPANEDSATTSAPPNTVSPTPGGEHEPTSNPARSSSDDGSSLGSSTNAGSVPQAARAPSSERLAKTRGRGSAAYESAEPTPLQSKQEVRPGLGTTWGETRTSYVSHVNFTRQTSNDPFTVFRLYYNDSNGLLAQTGERDLAALRPNYTESPHRFVSVEIVDPNGSALPGLYQNNHTYVLGRDGDRYAIRVRNHARQRFEVIATVDGLDVIDGKKGHFGKRGYILDSYATLLIEGFRRSGNAIAAFRFGSVADSYAARTSGDRNVGVIGVAVFAERANEPVYTDQEVERRETADPFPSQYARPPQPQRIRD